VRQLFFQINIKKFIEYISGEEKRLNEDKKLTEIFCFAMPPWYQAMAAQARFDYSSEIFQSISSFFS